MCLVFNTAQAHFFLLQQNVRAKTEEFSQRSSTPNLSSFILEHLGERPTADSYMIDNEGKEEISL
jgi:hypothetical protein